MTDERQVPSAEDMQNVKVWTAEVGRLESLLTTARERLVDAWSRVPFDPDVLRRPYRSDIAVSCRVCGKATTWRTAKGLAEHQPECPTVETTGRAGRKISDNVWELLTGTGGDDESLDDD